MFKYIGQCCNIEQEDDMAHIYGKLATDKYYIETIKLFQTRIHSNKLIIMIVNKIPIKGLLGVKVDFWEKESKEERSLM